MVTKQAIMQVWRVTTDVYGQYNRYVIGYVEGVGTVHGTIREADCELPVGSYHNEFHRIDLAVFYAGQALVSKVYKNLNIQE